MNPPLARRIRFTLHYDGSAFFGWQLQARERTVQGEVERVLSRLLDTRLTRYVHVDTQDYRQRRLPRPGTGRR